MPCTDWTASSASRDAAERQDGADEQEDQRAGGEGGDDGAAQPPDRRFERLRRLGQIARQRHEFGGDAAQACIGKTLGDALFQPLGGFDDQFRIKRAVAHGEILAMFRIWRRSGFGDAQDSAGALVRLP